MDAASLLETISDYCRRAGVAESTFGRLVLNDGKFVGRLREGGRIRRETLHRIEAYLHANPAEHRRARAGRRRRERPFPAPAAVAQADGARLPVRAPHEFRFYDNRQKYLLFVQTCSEKWAIAARVSAELPALQPHPPAVRMFDAGAGDGTVLARVIRALHQRYPTVPLYIVAKEPSVEGVRLVLEKMADRFFEHPATVLVLTNLRYDEAPWLAPRSLGPRPALSWREVPLTGSTADEFQRQICTLSPWLVDSWRAHPNPRSGRLGYDTPAVAVLFREDHRFALDAVIPRRGATRADYDLILASQAYRARAPLAFKSQRVLGPLARALAPAGRLLGIQGYGHDAGMEILQAVWPGESPFEHGRRAVLDATRDALGVDQQRFEFNASRDDDAVFRYWMHTVPKELSAPMGTSTLLAAWNAAVYVGQIDDRRLEAAMTGRTYIDAVRHVLRKHGGLWFLDESFVISRRND